MSENRSSRRWLKWNSWLESILLPRDRALNLPKTDDIPESELFPGQQDCIDESINTTVFMRLFQQTGLLRHHRVLDRAYRRSIWDQHWAAEIEEIGTEERLCY